MPADVDWHLRQSTAVDGVVDRNNFVSTFEARKVAIADAVFLALVEDRGEFTLAEVRSSWDKHATRHPFLAVNIAMEARDNPKSKPRTGPSVARRWSRHR